jgi:hypothetical protein
MDPERGVVLFSTKLSMVLLLLVVEKSSLKLYYLSLSISFQF